MLNVRKVLSSKGVSTLAVAKLLGVTEKTAYNKITGESEIYFNEAIKITDNFLPEYNMRYLFSEAQAEDHEKRQR